MAIRIRYNCVILDNPKTTKKIQAIKPMDNLIVFWYIFITIANPMKAPRNAWE